MKFLILFLWGVRPEMKSFVKVLLVLSIAASGYSLFWPGSGKDWTEIMVGEGTTAYRVSDELRRTEMISSPYPFLFWIKLRRADQKIHIGLYRFSKGRSAYWIVDDLVQGRTQKAKVIVPEGFAAWQIAERLGETRVCDPEKFKNVAAQKQLEGFLFPATYEMDLGLTPETAAKIMTDKFESEWTADMDARAAELALSKKQVVTLASIVEREVRVRDELPLVAAVYTNRLKKGMKLDADPTVQYALGFWKTRLLYSDYRNTKSPYNTYLVVGLPPGPICSPGADAIRAALWPATSNALYFVAQEDGRHSFSSTYREHTNKVNSRNRKKRNDALYR